MAQGTQREGGNHHVSEEARKKSDEGRHVGREERRKIGRNHGAPCPPRDQEAGGWALPPSFLPFDCPNPLAAPFFPQR